MPEKMLCESNTHWIKNLNNAPGIIGFCYSAFMVNLMDAIGSKYTQIGEMAQLRLI